MISKEIFIGLMIASMILSTILVIAFDGLLLYIKGVRLMDDEFDEMTKYQRFSFHIFEVTRITLFILLLFAIGINRGLINF